MRRQILSIMLLPIALYASAQTAAEENLCVGTYRTHIATEAGGKVYESDNEVVLTRNSDGTTDMTVKDYTAGKVDLGDITFEDVKPTINATGCHIKISKNVELYGLSAPADFDINAHDNANKTVDGTITINAPILGEVVSTLTESTSSVKDAAKAKSYIANENGRMFFSADLVGQTFTIYSLTGNKLLVGKAERVMSVSLQKGMYLININGRTTKFIVK